MGESSRQQTDADKKASRRQRELAQPEREETHELPPLNMAQIMRTPTDQLAPETLSRLQATLGNRATQAFLARRGDLTDSGAKPPATLPPVRGVVQPKRDETEHADDDETEIAAPDPEMKTFAGLPVPPPADAPPDPTAPPDDTLQRDCCGDDDDDTAQRMVIQRAPAELTTDIGAQIGSRVNQQIDTQTRQDDDAGAGGTASTSRSGSPASQRQGGVESTQTTERSAADQSQQATLERPDPAEVRSKAEEIQGEVRPDVNPTDVARPEASAAEQSVEQQAEAPPEPEPAADDGSQPDLDGGGEAKADSALAAAQAASAEAKQAAGAVDNVDGGAASEAAAQLVQPPEPIQVTDPASGEIVTADPAVEAQMSALAEDAQTLRDAGAAIAEQAAEGRSNAQSLRSNLAKVKGEIGKAEQGIAKGKAGTQARKEALTKADAALSTSKAKAEKVKSGAPDFSSKADDGSKKSGPMASEAKSMAGRSEALKPDDAKAAGDAQKQGQKLNQVGSDAGNIDDAMTKTKEKASKLGEEAAKATELNTQAETSITEGKTKVGEMDSRLDEMQTQAGQAKSQIEGLASGPGEVTAQASALDEQGKGFVESSRAIEQRLQQARAAHEAALGNLPPLEYLPEDELQRAPAHDDAYIQREPDEAGGADFAPPIIDMLPDDYTEDGIEVSHREMYGYDPLAFGDPDSAASDTGLIQRESLLDTGEAVREDKVEVGDYVPGWVTGVDPRSAEQRAAAEAAEKKRHADEIAQIDKLAEGDFNKLGPAQKAGIALQLVAQNYYNTVSQIKWPGAAKLAQMLLDPRTALTGIVSGLSMIATGVVGLKDIAKDPLGVLLKSAASVATGLTVILGTITALAALIAAAMGALMIVTLGAAAPIAVPVITFCTTVGTTVGGWTLTVGQVALVLQGLSLIKNLIDAATAPTAEKLQSEADSLRSDISGAGSAVMSIVGARGAQAGIQGARNQAAGIMNAARTAGGSGALGKQLVGGLAAGAKQMPGKLAAGAKKLPGAVASGSKKLAAGAKALPGKVASGSKKLAAGAKALPGKLASGAKALPGAVAKGAKALPGKLASGAKALPGKMRDNYKKFQDWLRDPFKKKGPDALDDAFDAYKADKALGRPPKTELDANKAALKQTGRKSDLTPEERDMELKLVQQSQPRPITGKGDYTHEVDLGNGHKWRFNGKTWCRFSGKPTNCTPGTLTGGPTATAGRAPRRVPEGYEVRQVTYDTMPDTVPSNTVLEFPDGSRVYRLKNGDIAVDSYLGPKTVRRGFEKDLPLPKEMGYEDFHRAHLLGQGTGFESPYGITYAPSKVNLDLQNSGIEEYLRQLQRTSPPGTHYRVQSTVSVHPGSRRLKEVQYRVHVEGQGQSRPMFEFSISVENKKIKPKVYDPVVSVSPDPNIQALIQSVDVPEILAARMKHIREYYAKKAAEKAASGGS